MTLSRTTLRDLQAALEEEEAACTRLDQEIAERQEERSRREQDAAFLRGAIDYLNRKSVDEKESAPKAIRNALFETLKEEGGPLHYGELLRRLEDQGVSVNGKDPLRLVGAHLSNDSRFRSVGGGRWALAAWPDAMLQDGGGKSESRTSGPIEPIALHNRLRDERGQHPGAPSRPTQAGWRTPESATRPQPGRDDGAMAASGTDDLDLPF